MNDILWQSVPFVYYSVREKCFSCCRSASWLKQRIRQYPRQIYMHRHIVSTSICYIGNDRPKFATGMRVEQAISIRSRSACHLVDLHRNYLGWRSTFSSALHSALTRRVKKCMLLLDQPVNRNERPYVRCTLFFPIV